MTIIEIDNVNSVEEERQVSASLFKFFFMMTIAFILFAYLTERAEPAIMAIFPGILHCKNAEIINKIKLTLILFELDVLSICPLKQNNF